LINTLRQLRAREFDSKRLYFDIPKADVGGADLRGLAVSLYQRIDRPGLSQERNLLRLKSEIEHYYPDAFTGKSG
jgi:hypothetical protein